MKGAIGKIKGYNFRLFQELNTSKVNGTNDKYNAYLCIKDGNTKGGMWNAFYNQVDIDNWVNSLPHTNENI